MLRVHIADDAVLVFRESALEIYVLPSAPDACLELHPAAVHQWQWQINALAVSPRTSWAHRAHPNARNPLSILIRFDSWFPWPVNIIHHFVLRPAPPSAPGGGAPYLLPPVLQDSIASSVRLFGRAELAVSPFGTALWMDSEAGGPGGSADVGERIAGRRLPVGARADSESGAGEAGEQAKGRGATMLFATHEQDGWNALAMDEEAGRVAVGDVDGNIEIWDYL